MHAWVLWYNYYMVEILAMTRNEMRTEQTSKNLILFQRKYTRQTFQLIDISNLSFNRLFSVDKLHP